jgi:hypothetical protein
MRQAEAKQLASTPIPIELSRAS